MAALAGIGLVCLVFAPGQMSADAILQLKQARAGEYNDWHPAVMSWVWSGLDRLLPGPLGMLLLHNLLFWGGLAAFVAAGSWRPGAAALAILAVGLFPPIFTALGTLWKDVGMGAALLLAFALLRLSSRRAALRERPVLALAAIVPLGYALAVRHNALPAILPPALWAGALAWRRVSPARFLESRRRVAAGLVGLAILGSLWSVVRLADRWLEVERLYIGQSILLHDVAGISLATGTQLIPATRVAEGELTLPNLACVYDPGAVTTFFNARLGACPLRLHKITREEDFAALFEIWRGAVAAHPAAYLAHRWRVFSATLGIDGRRTCYPLAVGHDPNDLDLTFRRTAVYDLVLKGSAVLAYGTPLFRGWIYYLAIVALLLLARRVSGADRAAFYALGASGLAYGLSYLVVGLDCAFRLNWWPIVAVAAMALLLIDSRREPLMEENLE